MQAENSLSVLQDVYIANDFDLEFWFQSFTTPFFLLKRLVASPLVEGDRLYHFTETDIWKKKQKDDGNDGNLLTVASRSVCLHLFIELHNVSILSRYLKTF